MLNPSDASPTKTRTLAAIRVAIFAIVTAIAAWKVAPDVVDQFRNPPLDAGMIREAIRLSEGDIPVPPGEIQRVWDSEKFRAFRVPFERISTDVEREWETKRKYLDKEYARQLVLEINEAIQRHPEVCRDALAAYVEFGKTPRKRAMALITLRKRFSKKNSLFYAMRLEKSDQPLLKNLSIAILSNQFDTQEGLGKKLTVSYLAKFEGGDLKGSKKVKGSGKKAKKNV